jgi:hypothetical protein
MNKKLVLVLLFVIAVGTMAYIGYYQPVKTNPVDLLTNGTVAILDSSSNSMDKITDKLNNFSANH